jgi:hypothetical protein
LSIVVTHKYISGETALCALHTSFPSGLPGGLIVLEGFVGNLFRSELGSEQEVEGRSNPTWDKINPSNYRNIMISPILAKIYKTILEKKISIWLEIHRKRDKGQARFRCYHSIMDHLVTLRIIVEEF